MYKVSRTNNQQSQMSELRSSTREIKKIKKTRNDITKDFKRQMRNQTNYLEQFKSKYKELDETERSSRKKNIIDKQKDMKKNLKEMSGYYKETKKILTKEENKSYKKSIKDNKKEFKKSRKESKKKFLELEGESEGKKHTKKLAGKFIKGTASSVEKIYSVKKDINKNTGYSMDELKGLSDKYREKSKASGNKISVDKYMGSAKALTDMGYKDMGFLEEMGGVLTEVSHSTGKASGEMKKLSEFANTIGNSKMAYQYGNMAKAISSDKSGLLKTNASDLMQVYEDRYDNILNKSNGDVGKFNSSMKEQYKIKAFADANNLGGSFETINGAIDSIHKGDKQVLNSLKYLKIDAKELQGMLKSGKDLEATQKLVEGVKKNYNNLDDTEKKELNNTLKLDNKTLEGMSKTDVSKFDSQKSAIDNALKASESEDFLKKFLDKEIVSPVEKFKNWATNSKVGSLIEGLMDSTGLSMSDVSDTLSIITDGKDLFKSFGKSKVGKWLGSKLKTGGSKIGSGLKTAGRSFIGSASSGTGATGILANIGSGLGAGGGSATAAAGIGAGAVAGGALGAAGLYSGYKDFQAAENEKDMKKKRELNYSGGTKMGLVGAGAATGAAIGSVVPIVGTAAGALIGAGVGGVTALLGGEDLGKLVSDGTTSIKQFFQSGISGWNSMTGFMKNPMSKEEFIATFKPSTEAMQMVNDMSEQDFREFQMNTMSKWSKEEFQETFKPTEEAWSSSIDNMSSMWDTFSEWIGQGLSNIGNWLGEKINGAKEALYNFNEDRKENGLGTAITNFAGRNLPKNKEQETKPVQQGNAIKPIIPSITGTPHKNGLDRVPYDEYRAILHKDEAVLTAKEANSWRKGSLVDGSHKNGLDTVPKDGYVAELHKDEAVLNAEQAKTWRAGQTGEGSKDFYSNMVKDLTPQLRENLANLNTAGTEEPVKGVMANGDDFLGAVSAKYEVSYPNKNADYISSGKGDFGGKSYGLPQFTSKGGGASANNFVAWLKGKFPQLGGLFGNNRAGTSGFDSAWKKAYQTNQDLFRSAQQSYAYSTYVTPFISKAKKKYNVDLNRSRALQELAFSSAIQFGGGGIKALGNISGSMNDEQIISTSFKAKRNNVNSWFKSSSSSLRNSLRSGRFTNEEKDIKGYLGKPSLSAYEQGTPWVPSTQVALLHKGEMVVPKEHNPIVNSSKVKGSSSNTSTETLNNEDVGDLIDVMKWGISRLERKLEQLNNTTASINTNSEKPKKAYKTDLVYNF